MPSFCAVASCNDRYGHSENISFHKFPLKRSCLLKQWEAFIQRQRGEDWHASRWSSLCSRHFREEDFRSLNERRTLKKSAVPTILGANSATDKDINKCKSKRATKVIVTCENTRDKEFKEILAIKEHLEDTVVEAPVPKSNCRLCGVNSIPFANFLTNYELYGLVQKCFPTLNIQQEDTLPKVMCAACHKSLEEFGTFVERVCTAQTELQKKFRSRAVEKPVKIKQEPLVRVKQEVAESGYNEHQETNGFGGGNEEYDAAMDGSGHEEGDDQKYEFCDFPIINDCDIMEIINLDDPFINIPDDDNTTTVNEEDEYLQKPIHEPVINYTFTAHELLQSHMLMEEHSYAVIDADEFKEERQIYKTEKSDNDERLIDYTVATNQQQEQLPIPNSYNVDSGVKPDNPVHSSNSTEYSNGFEKRALKPIVTSVSAIQQPTKSSNGIVVLNESIVKSGCGFQLHACMVCQLKFFAVESLRQHYTQTHGTPMVTVPSANIPLEKVTPQTCKMEKEFTESNIAIQTNNEKSKTYESDSRKDASINNVKENDLQETKQETEQETPDILSEKKDLEKQMPKENEDIVLQNTAATKQCLDALSTNNINEQKSLRIKNKQKNKVSLKSRKSQNVSLNAMANQYQQLRKLYQKLQKKCTNLEQNVEQLLPITAVSKTTTVTKTTAAIKTTEIAITNKKTRAKLNSIPKQKSSKPKPVVQSLPNASIKHKIPEKKVFFTCAVCSKSFANANSLRQHKITHTEERKHQCTLCQRTFKRRNGLLQHLKGFHLQVKPFSCPVCKHSYSLKCDMLRCKHSILRNLQIPLEKSGAVSRSRLVLKKLEK